MLCQGCWSREGYSCQLSYLKRWMYSVAVLFLPTIPLEVSKPIWVIEEAYSDGTFGTREQCLLQGAHHDLSWCRSLTLTQQKKRRMGSHHLGIAAAGFCSYVSAFQTLQHFSHLSRKDTKKTSMILSAKVSSSNFPMLYISRISLCDFS